ncbi:MAG: hypothetical protein IJ459_00880 [Clostridia bacterium]|nr:hypothetical protein [Clostridia bacterium]
MFKRRSVIAAFLVVALLAVGVGFAAVSDTLSVGGMLQATKSGAETQFDVDVNFEDAIGTLPNNCTVVLGDNDDRATITINNSTDLAHTGDAVSIILPIVNNSVYDATLTVGTSTGVGEGFSVEYTLYSDEACQTELSPSQVSKNGGMVYLLVSIELTGDPTVLADGETITHNLGVMITATSIDANN